MDTVLKANRLYNFLSFFSPDVGTGAIDVLLTRHGTRAFATVKRHESSL